jgi:hypothetical protein
VPEARACRVAVSRVQYRVALYEIFAWQFAFLSAARNPISIVECATLCAADAHEPVEKVLAQLVTWLPEALQRGYLTFAD